MRNVFNPVTYEYIRENQIQYHVLIARKISFVIIYSLKQRACFVNNDISLSESILQIVLMGDD